jgi:CO/xanthine dehydrogenase Mo-binding subunit
MAPAPALANAVYDAVRARVKSLPINAEKIVKTLRGELVHPAQVAPT